MAFVSAANTLHAMDPFRPRTRSMTNGASSVTNTKRHESNGHTTQNLTKFNRSRNEMTTIPRNKEPRQIQSQQHHAQAPMHNSMTTAVAISVPKPRVYLPRRKIKRVPVTSCDTCRFRKLRCNSKELKEGEKCSQCTKSGIPCTFEDRDEMLQLPKVVKSTSTRKKKSSAQQDDMIKNGTQIPLAANYSPYPTHAAVPTQNWAYNMLASNNNAYQYQPHNMIGTSNLHAQLDYNAISLQAFQQPVQMPWQSWDLPSRLTNAQTGTVYDLAPEQLIDYLINRFYQDNTFSAIILPDRGYTHESILPGSTQSLPTFLLKIVLACAAWSDLSIEPELVAWRKTIWASATQSVHDQLSSTMDFEIELIQALLLLCTTWPGDLVRVERINTLDAAIGVATSIGLQNSSHLGSTIESQSLRLVLFWSLYCLDKILCAATGRVPSLPSTCHDMPLPTNENIFSLHIPGIGSELAWIQRLSISFIKLCQLLEEIHSTLFEPIAMRWMTSLQEVLMTLHELEAKLEQFCREHRWFLSNITSFSTPHRAIAEAVITQMHLTQLQLYIAPLKFEVTFSSVRPMDFSNENQKSLTATIESAWHLVQQALRDNRTIDAKTEKSMSLSLAALHFGANAFRFLATSWVHWQGGTGCVPYAPRSTLEGGNGQAVRETYVQNEAVHENQSYTNPITASSTQSQSSPLVPHVQQNAGTSKQRYSRVTDLAVLNIENRENTNTDSDNRNCTSEEQGAQVIEVSSSADPQRTEGTNVSATSPTSLAICTPARLLFKDSESLQDMFNRIGQSSVEQTASTSRQFSPNANRQMEDCQKMHAMLAPMDPTLVNEMSKLESLLFSGGEVYTNEGWHESESSLTSEQGEEDSSSANGSSNYIHGPSSSNNTYNTSNLAQSKQQCRTLPDSHILTESSSHLEQTDRTTTGVIASHASFAPRTVK